MFARNLCKKIVFRSKGTKVIKSCTSLTPIRTLLSAFYLSKNDADVFLKSTKQTEEIALQSLALDRCHERDIPVSSLMVDRLIRAIDDKEHLKGSMYYLFKFRHSQNNYYIQPWSVFAFVLKCLELDSSVLIETLANKKQYGVFPQSFMMNFALDKFLKRDDLDGAMSCVSEMFLLETLDNEISQILALHTIWKYWNQNCEEDQIVPEFRDLKMKRDISAALFSVGHYLFNSSLMLIGNSLLGTIELEHGIRAIYQDPWGPTSCEPGYLDRAVALLETSTTPVSQQSVDILLQCASKNEEILAKAQNALKLAQSKNTISNDNEFTLEGISKTIEKNLSKHEEKEQKEISDLISTWKYDCDLLEELEKEVLEKFEVARKKHFREIAIEEKAHQMAVETLGYWDLKKGRQENETEKTETEEKTLYYLREDYVEGAMEDLELIERFREKRSIISDPVILMS